MQLYYIRDTRNKNIIPPAFIVFGNILLVDVVVDAAVVVIVGVVVVIVVDTVDVVHIVVVIIGVVVGIVVDAKFSRHCMLTSPSFTYCQELAPEL